MEERNVIFDTAKLAKSKGFPQTVLGMKEFSLMTKKLTDKHFGDNIKAPTQTLLKTWLREKHNIHVNPVRYIQWYADVERIDLNIAENQLISSTGDFDSFEDALEAGLLLALSKID